MVPGTEWRLFGTVGHAAYVGRNIRRLRLLAVLDVARILSQSARGFDLHTGVTGCCGTGLLDGISQPPTIARGKSPYRAHAGSPAKVDCAFGELRHSPPLQSCLFLWRARGTHLRGTLLFLPQCRKTERAPEARQL